MAVTHADLEPRRRKTDLSSKTGVFLMALTILLGLFCFILCLIAEATRSKVLVLLITCLKITYLSDIPETIKRNEHCL